MHGSVDPPLQAACLCNSAKMTAPNFSPIPKHSCRTWDLEKKERVFASPSLRFLLVRPGMMRKHKRKFCKSQRAQKQRMGQNCCENIHLPHITKKSGHKEINFRHSKKVEVWTWGKWSFSGFPALISLGFLFKMSESGDRGGGFECPSALQGVKITLELLG